MIRTLACAAAAATLALVAASAGSAAAKPLKVGISLSLSGDFSDSGKAAERGYKLWANVVNGKGGVLGRKVQLIIKDDTSSPTQASSNYQTLRYWSTRPYTANLPSSCIQD